MTYQLVIQRRNGAQLVDLVNATQRRFSFYLNRPSEFSCILPATAPEATRDNLQPGTRELIAYRNGSPLETVFALTRVGVRGDSDSVQLELGFDGIACYLADGIVLANSNGYTGTAVPWGWINTFQSRTGGGYGITQGQVVGTAPSRTRVIEQDGTILDEIVNLSETGSGFDFAIDANRAYREWHTQRGVSSGVVLAYGVNIVSFDYEESTAPGEIVTDVRAYGASNSGAPRVAADTAARDTYGRREAVVSYASESEAATVTAGQLQNFADAALNRSSPLIIPQVELVASHPSVTWGSYWLGDTVDFQAQLGSYASINAQYRIVGIHVELDDNDNETVKLDLNAV